MNLEKTLTPGRSRIAIAAIVLAVWVPAVWNLEINDLDDRRFILDNPHVHELSAGKAVTYFTDPTTIDPLMWQGIYRPLRTLDFAIDWAIGGEAPLVYHLHSALYHVLAALLAFEVFRRLARGLAAPFCGALLFALHPVQTECVAWITSRGDVMMLCLFLLALLLHLDRRYWLSVPVLVLSLFAKETTVVFPAVVVLADLYVRSRPGGVPAEGTAPPLPFKARVRSLPWVPYAIYGVLVVGFYFFWRSMMPGAGHLNEWWGGSYAANLQTMVRGLLYYARVLVLPADLVYDYHVPGVTSLDAGTIAGVLLIAGLGFGLWKGGPRVRFAILWFGVTILPTANLLYTVGIPTAERFLYLPTVGLAFGLGHLLARTRLRWAVLLCLALLTVDRTLVWKSDDTLFAAVGRRVETPRLFHYRATEAVRRAGVIHEERKKRPDDPELLEQLEREVEITEEAARKLLAFYADRLRVPPSLLAGTVLQKKANALLMADRDEEGLATALESAHKWQGGPYAHFNAGLAAQRLGERRSGGYAAALGVHRMLEALTAAAGPGPQGGVGSATRLLRAALRPAETHDRLRAAEYFEQAARELDAAARKGYTDSDLRPVITRNLLAAATELSRVADAEVGGERKGELRRAAGDAFLRAANVAITLVSPDSRQSAMNAMLLYERASDSLEPAASLLSGSRHSSEIADVLRRAGEAAFQAGDLKQRLGAGAEAVDSFLRSASLLRQASEVLDRSLGTGAGEEARRIASTALIRAASILEGIGEMDEARRFYRESWRLFQSVEAERALRRLGR